jgi:ATP-dependent DNA helicase RecQ
VTQAMAVMTELERLAKLDAAWDWRRVAVIAREWKTLDPLRSYCELQRIPVQMANEDTAQFWRLRETQVLVTWLRKPENKLVDSDTIEKWLDEQSTGTWWSLLREAVEEYAIETGAAELPRDHFLNWLFEWGREIRRRQTGLLLLTAHRAKGLEFDHVAVLDGGWNKTSRGEDPDAPRRLYYVAMTRARQTLTLARLGNGQHRLLDGLLDGNSVLIREAIVLPHPPAELSHRHVRPELNEVDIGFAGRYAANHPTHQAIANLTSDDQIFLIQRNERWDLTDMNGKLIGRMSKKFSPPPATEFLSARVVAIIVRLREDSPDEYQAQIGCDHWEVVVPELVFAPAISAPPRA